MNFTLEELVVMALAAAMLFIALGYLLGRWPAKAQKRFIRYNTPGEMRLPYDPNNPLNAPGKRTDGW